jgi:hypothetical protein
MFTSRYKNITRTQRQNLQNGGRRKENPIIQLKNLKSTLLLKDRTKKRKLRTHFSCSVAFYYFFDFSKWYSTKTPSKTL